MSISIDLPHKPFRRLKKNFSGAAIGTVNPNTMHSNAPSMQDAMGITPQSGILNFTHDGASQNITVYTWNEQWNEMDPAHGWDASGENSGVNTKQVDPHSTASFKCPPNVPYFLLAATSAINNVLVHDNGALNTNLNTDTSKTYP